MSVKRPIWGCFPLTRLMSAHWLAKVKAWWIPLTDHHHLLRLNIQNRLLFPFFKSLKPTKDNKSTIAFWGSSPTGHTRIPSNSLYWFLELSTSLSEWLQSQLLGENFGEISLTSAPQGKATRRSMANRQGGIMVLPWPRPLQTAEKICAYLVRYNLTIIRDIMVIAWYDTGWWLTYPSEK
jgi:hypothetical protein